MDKYEGIDPSLLGAGSFDSRKNSSHGAKDSSGDDIDFNIPSDNKDAEQERMQSLTAELKLEIDSNTCFTRNSLSTREDWCRDDIKTLNVEYCAEMYCSECCSLYVPFNEINKCASTCESGTAHISVNAI